MSSVDSAAVGSGCCPRHRRSERRRAATQRHRGRAELRLSAQPPTTPLLTLDFAGLTATITEPLERLRSALTDVAREAREAGTTLVAKQVALAEYDTTFSAVASTFEGLFTLAGARELARRVRPSRRRPGQVDLVPEPGQGEGGGEDEGGSAP